ncbi:MAG: potassium transporter KefB [Deltaproteobacteria bacterium]|nr:potassium transporter KefB [Deltaproteobacteria bacterium]
MQISLLNDILIIFGLSVLILFACNRLRVPAVVGFLFTGILVGPYGLGLIKALHEVEILAEIGVVLLLFTIGIEFSFQKMLQIKRPVLLGGALQVGLTCLAAFLVARRLGQPVGEAVFLGFLFALSSTAIVLRLIQERAEVDSPHGSTTLGILIFQDVAIVPMILVTPLLAGTAGGSGGAALLLVAKGLGIVALVIVSTKWVVPRVLYQVARTGSQELFLLSVIAICLSVALLTAAAGLSLALGAFLAGLIISESEYSHRALGNILPFRDAFTTFFFVSIGMLLDVGFLLREPAAVTLLALGILVLKSAIAALAALLLGLPLRTSVLVGLALGQVGEFSFILSRTGVEHGLVTGDLYQLFLAGAVLTMAATPFVIALAPKVADAAVRLPLPRRLKTGLNPAPAAADEARRDHLVIIGFGVSGRNVARAAAVAGIPYAVIELNPDTVRTEQARGEPIRYGDATQETVLEHANVPEARVVVVAINDPTATRRVTEAVRRLNPKAYLIVRTQYLQEMGHLYDLGADEVIPQEFETSVEIFTRVLTKYLVPRDEIERLVTAVRADGYEMLRSLSGLPPSVTDLKLQLPHIEIVALKVAEGSALAGASLAQAELRKTHGVTVLALRRGTEIEVNPPADMELRPGDVLFVLGPPERIADVAGLCRGERPGS